MLAALVLDMLGVDREVIVADYLITAERMPLILDRYRSDPAFAERMATVPAVAVQRRGLHHGAVPRRAPPAPRWGPGRGRTAAGVPAEALDRMGELLLEPVG